MVDFKISNMPKFKEEVLGTKCNVKKLKIITNQIIQCFEDEQHNFCNLCYSLLELRNLFNSDECDLHTFETEDARYPFERYVNDFFGLDLRYVEKCIRCYTKFMKKLEVGGTADVSIILLPDFQNFSKSKLFELLVVSSFQLSEDINKGVLTPDMSFKQIREYVKSLKGTEKKENQVLEEANPEINEDDIPKAYDPSLHYEDKYFMALAKSQLVNNIITLQEYCEKLQVKIKELKKKIKFN